MNKKLILTLLVLTIPLFAQYGFDFTCLDDTIEIVTDTTTVVTFYFRLQNTGSVPDSYAVDCRIIDSVSGWDELFCVGGLCALPGVVLYDYLNAGEVDTTIDVSVFPGSNYGIEVLNLKVNSVGDPNLKDSISLIVQKELAVEEEQKSKFERVRLRTCPNPFTKKIDIRYVKQDIRYRTEDFSLRVYDISGRLVRDLTNNLASSVLHRATAVSWDGTDYSSRELPSGVYFLTFTSGDYSATEKLLLIR
jgi:hypothetical protein